MKVSYEEGKEAAEKYGIAFFETSAKEDRNIKETFYYLAKEIKEKVLAVESPNGKTESTNINSLADKKGKEKKQCC